MELADALLRGLVIGLLVAAPVGPIGILCIRRTLSGGRLIGFVSGLGAAAADAVYGCVAAFGLTAISDLLVDHRLPLRLAGGTFLLYLGAKTFLEKPAERADAPGGTPARGLAGACASTFFLTIASPVTILFFAATFAGLGLAGAAGGYAPAATLVGGVFCGSALWWLCLSAGVSLLRPRLGDRALRWVNRISGTFILGFGTAALTGM